MIDPQTLPQTVEAEVADLISKMDNEDVDYVKTHEYTLCRTLLGRSILNDWILWASESPVLQDGKRTYKIHHPDDLLELIVAWAYAKINRLSFDPFAHCAQHEALYDQMRQTAVAYSCCFELLRSFPDDMLYDPKPGFPSK